MTKPYPPPIFDIFIKKDEDNTYTVAIVMSGIPNRKLANLTLNWMKEAMNDQITKLMGKLALQEKWHERREERKEEPKR